MLGDVGLVKNTSVSEEPSASIFSIGDPLTRSPPYELLYSQYVWRFASVSAVIFRWLDFHAVFVTAMTMKSTVSWYMTSCHVVDFNGRFGETYCLHLQGRRLNRIIRLKFTCFAYSSTLKMEAVRPLYWTVLRHIPDNNTRLSFVLMV
jgi:hypothetical protein